MKIKDVEIGGVYTGAAHLGGALLTLIDAMAARIAALPNCQFRLWYPGEAEGLSVYPGQAATRWCLRAYPLRQQQRAGQRHVSPAAFSWGYDPTGGGEAYAGQTGGVVGDDHFVRTDPPGAPDAAALRIAAELVQTAQARQTRAVGATAAQTAGEAAQIHETAWRRLCLALALDLRFPGQVRVVRSELGEALVPALPASLLAAGSTRWDRPHVRLGAEALYPDAVGRPDGLAQFSH